MYNNRNEWVGSQPLNPWLIGWIMSMKRGRVIITGWMNYGPFTVYSMFTFLKYWCSAHFRWMHNILGYCKEYWQCERPRVSIGSSSTARGSLVPGPSYVKKGGIVFLIITFLYFILFYILPNQYLSILYIG